jgi:hypothetical protein
MIIFAFSSATYKKAYKGALRGIARPTVGVQDRRYSRRLLGFV